MQDTSSWAMAGCKTDWNVYNLCISDWTRAGGSMKALLYNYA